MPETTALSSQRIEVQEDDPIELLYSRGVTDGLPVVPPTEQRVQRMLAATDRDPQELIGLIGPNYGRATVEKVAINAVMAGCRPEYMKVVVAAVDSTAAAALGLTISRHARTTGRALVATLAALYVNQGNDTGGTSGSSFNQSGPGIGVLPPGTYEFAYELESNDRDVDQAAAATAAGSVRLVLRKPLLASARSSP